MTRMLIWAVAAAGLVISAGACTGGDMGNTRGGGAAPGQSGGRDTTNASAAAAASAGTAGSTGPAKAGATGAAADTTKQRTATKRP